MTWIQRAGREAIAAVATLLGLACGGDGDDNGPVGNTGSIQVAVNSATLSVPQGGSGSVTVTLTRGGGFGGAVTLAVTGLPAGVTPAITPTQLSSTTTSATIDVTVAATVAAQTYTATITATAQGVSQATTTYQLMVTAAPDYTLTVAPATVTITAGSAGGTTVNIARTNFTGGVALALLNPPTGITGAFGPTPSTTNESALAVSMAANVAAGNYPLTIQGTATGPGVRTTTLTVSVTPPPTGGNNVQYVFCDESDAPVFFAYQDGTGAWQAVTGSTSTGGAIRFAFNLTQGRGGVLMVYLTSSPIVADAVTVGRTAGVRRITTRPRFGDRILGRFGVAPGRTGTLDRQFVADEHETSVIYASTSELAQDGAEACAPTPPTKTVTGIVAGVSPGQYGVVSFGGATKVFNGATTTNPVTFTDVQPGAVDLVGTRITTPGAPPDKAIVFRNLDVPDGGSLPATIDFNGPSSSVPATASTVISGGAGDALEIFTEVVTANSHSLFWFDLAPSTNSTRPWAGLNPATMVAGDFHGLVVFATPPGGGPTNFRVSLKFVGPVTDQTLALGPAISAPAISQVAAGAYPRLRFQGTFPSEYDKGAFFDVASESGSGNVFSIVATGAYLTASGNAPAYDITMPDVVGVAGFPAAARLNAGPNAVTATAFGFTGPGLFDLRPTLGGESRAATKGATINVP